MDLPEGTRLSCQDDDNDYVWRGGRPEKIRQIHNAMIGQHAPTLLAKKWYNSPSDGLELGGKVVLLDFFGIWCRPCMAKIPFIKELHELYSDRGLVVIGIHTEVAQEKIPAFISNERINYAIAVDSNGLNAESFNIFSYPTMIFIDSEGILRAINPDETELKNLLKLYLK